MKIEKSKYKFKLIPQNTPTLKTKYREIKTKIPHKNDVKIFKSIINKETSSLENQLPIVWHRAKNFNLYDRWGNKWIDLTSAIFVANTGHANKKSIKNIKKIISKGLLHSYCYPTVERQNFLNKLIKITPRYLNQASLVTTGTEASERAIKLAKLYGMKFFPTKDIIIGGTGNFHGKTMGAMMAASTKTEKKWIGKLKTDMRHIPFPYPWIIKKNNSSERKAFQQDIKKILNKGVDPKKIAAFIIESYQGWGAVFYPKNYIKEMAKWAKHYNVLIIVDEIQSGFGRTGKLFGYQHYGIKPDLVICGKAISGNLPLSAVLGPKRLIELDPTLTSTHGGHPLSCTAALGNLEVLIEKNLVKRSNKLGKKLKIWLEKWKDEFSDRIPLVLGNGLVWAIFISKPNSNILDAELTDKIIEKAMQKGVYALRTGCGTIKLGPPLTINEEALKEGINVLRSSMREILI